MKHKVKTWEETMTPEEVQWCIDRIYSIISYSFPDEHCIDNFRAAKCGISSQMRRFRKYERNGCCGSHNEFVFKSNGLFRKPTQFIVGFNYGH